MEQHKESRGFACDARCCANNLTLALECYYWSGDKFHYEEALKNFADLVKFLDKMKESFEGEAKSNEGEA
jgi:hypothetical protein